ncbi:MAG: zinc-binding dehydrogenase [Bacillaceae bacterium]
MKAVVINEFGHSSVLQVGEMPYPICPAGHVIVKVKASSVNPIDVKIRSGVVQNIAPELPAVLHGDVCGLVEEIGEGVTKFRVGDEVFGFCGGVKGSSGALAEYIVCDARLLAPKPKHLRYTEVAAMGVVGLTAMNMLEKAKLRSGQHILIHGGTGGVGHVLIQLAKKYHVTISTTVGSVEKGEIATSLGANHVIYYRDEKVESYVDRLTNNKGFDVVFDTVGGEVLKNSFEAAKGEGTVVSIATRGMHDLSTMHNKALSLHVVFILLAVLTNENREKHEQRLLQLSKLLKNNEVKPLINERIYPFSMVGKAHDALEKGIALGKIALENDL